jgi:hypothetical protein
MQTARTWVLASLSCFGLFGAGACRPIGDDDADEYRNAIPRQETVTMQVPADGQTGQALEVESRGQALRGATSDFYLVTRRVSTVVNGAGALVLGLVKAVVAHPPTTMTADTAVWGPWPGGALDPLVYKVTVKKSGDHKYDYTFEARGKGAADTASFTAFLTGTHTPAVDAAGHPLEGFGAGSFTLDWDARATLPAPDDNVGKAHYDYARPSVTAGVSVDAKFTQVKDDEHPGQRVDVDYLYRSMPGAGGSMEFVHSLPASMAAAGARWAVKSRWTAAGAGRSDVVATGASLPGTAMASECWNSSFASVYLVASWVPGGGYGDEATDCVFKPADYSKL